ncbi:uncharacterized protein P884DRAFT_279956 [Thermothelomyces heterothallicus CBS 202.75]|uniref:uncharacterized protein n=1 Tax=Thermothelomyces heterothallicus CBS 202.75 TaxID=1149848 RepID=UPI003742240A
MGRAAQWQPSGENLGSKKSEMRYVAPRVTADRILRPARQAQSRRGGFARLARGGSKHFPSPSETRSGRLHTNSALGRVQDRGLDHSRAAAREEPERTSEHLVTYDATLLSITLARCAQLAER